MTIEKKIVGCALWLALVFGAAGHAAALMPSGERTLIGAVSVVENFAKTELYFGLGRKGGPDVSDAEFQAFVDEFVTPRFPMGFTILEATGQWREDDNSITKERSKVLVVAYPRKERRSAGVKLEEIRAEYIKRFAQKSVIRIDMGKSLQVSF